MWDPWLSRETKHKIVQSGMGNEDELGWFVDLLCHLWVMTVRVHVVLHTVPMRLPGQTPIVVSLRLPMSLTGWFWTLGKWNSRLFPGIPGHIYIWSYCHKIFFLIHVKVDTPDFATWKRLFLWNWIVDKWQQQQHACLRFWDERFLLFTYRNANTIISSRVTFFLWVKDDV